MSAIEAAALYFYYKNWFSFQTAFIPLNKRTQKPDSTISNNSYENNLFRKPYTCLRQTYSWPPKCHEAKPNKGFLEMAEKYPESVGKCFRHLAKQKRGFDLTRQSYLDYQQTSRLKLWFRKWRVTLAFHEVSFMKMEFYYAVEHI